MGGGVEGGAHRLAQPEKRLKKEKKKEIFFISRSVLPSIYNRAGRPKQPHPSKPPTDFERALQTYFPMIGFKSAFVFFGIEEEGVTMACFSASEQGQLLSSPIRTTAA